MLNVTVKNEIINALELGQSVDGVPIVPGESGIVSPMAPEIKFVIVNLDASGGYESIKIFLSQINKMEIINKINSLSISKSIGNDVGGDNLTASVEIKFGYMSYINQVENSLPSVFSESNFNFNAYSKISDLIARKIPVLDAGQKGKANPFLP